MNFRLFRDSILAWFLFGLMTEKLWSIILGVLFISGMVLMPLVFLNIVSSAFGFFFSWLIAMICAFAAHIYRRRAMMWEVLCVKAQREAGEFVDGLAESFTKPKLLVLAVSPQENNGGGERMPN